MAQWPKNDWLTPPGIIQPLEVLGGVGLDPCSNPWSLVKATTRIMLPKYRGKPIMDGRCVPFFSKKGIVYGDGLELPWADQGLVYINPPYSRPAPWAERAHFEAGPLNCTESVLLLPASTSEAWFHKWIVPADEICFLDGRLRFYTGQGPASHSADKGNILVYWGDRVDLFRKAYEGYGWFAKKMDGDVVNRDRRVQTVESGSC